MCIAALSMIKGLLRSRVSCVRNMIKSALRYMIKKDLRNMIKRYRATTPLQVFLSVCKYQPWAQEASCPLNPYMPGYAYHSRLCSIGFAISGLLFGGGFGRPRLLRFPFGRIPVRLNTSHSRIVIFPRLWLHSLCAGCRFE